MGNQHTTQQHTHAPSYYSVEYLNGSTGTSVPDLVNREYSTSSSGSITIEQSFHNTNETHEDTQETLSTIIQPVPMIRNKMCTILRSKSYVRPENKVLPGEIPTKPLRKTNFLQTDGYKRTWRHKNGKKQAPIKDNGANCSHLSMPEINNPINNGHKTNIHRTESESSGEWQRPSSIAAIRDQRHIMQNEIKNFRDKYSRSMDNLEEWTTEDVKIESCISNRNNQAEKNNILFKKISNAQDKLNKQAVIEAEKKSKEGLKIDPVKVQPLMCSPNEKKVALKKNILRPPHLTSTPTNLDREHELSFAISDSKYSDKSSGILVKKLKSNLNKEVRKSVDFCLDKDLENITDKSFISKISEDKPQKLSKAQQKQKDEVKKNTTTKTDKCDTIMKAKAILLESRRRQLMEQSINESLDLQETANVESITTVPKIKEKLKSKSFLYNDSSKSKSDSIKLKFGIRSTRQRKKDDRFKILDLEKDIQIISRFPIDSKVYRHYIGNTCDKLTNSYNAVKKVKPEDDKLTSQSFVSIDSSESILNERGIDVNDDKKRHSKSELEFENDVRKKEQKTVIDTINQVFDPIYDSIDEYQSNKNNFNCNQVKGFVNSKFEKNDAGGRIRNNQVMEPYSALLKSTTSFKPIAKVNPTSIDFKVKVNVCHNNNDHGVTVMNKNQFDKDCDLNKPFDSNASHCDDKNILSFQERISKFDSQSNNLSLNINSFCSDENNDVNNNFNNNKNDPQRYVNRKCSMNSDKLEPILEGTPNKSIGDCNKIKRKSTIGKFIFST
jgi:hypothetical protein